VFGWPAMLSMLQNEGVYGHFCPNQPITDCNEATIKFNAIFNAGSFGNTGASLVFGWLLDRFGQRVTSVVGHLLMIMGVLLFAFSSNSRGLFGWHISTRSGSGFCSHVTDDFFLEGYLLIGIAGNPLQLAVLAFCNEFENASTAMSVNCGVFAASSALFMILKVSLSRFFLTLDPIHTAPTPLRLL
jgi:MFS family permease